jgi:hypothetical protein
MSIATTDKNRKIAEARFKRKAGGCATGTSLPYDGAIARSIETPQSVVADRNKSIIEVNLAFARPQAIYST